MAKYVSEYEASYRQFEAEAFIENGEGLPRNASPADHADWLRRFNGWQKAEPANLGSFIDYMGWSLKFMRFKQAKGFLMPSDRTGFCITVDPHQAQVNDPKEVILQEPEVRYTIAHEIGHTIFYRPTKPPRRIVPRPAGMFGKDREETFCDEFAACLLVPPSIAADALRRQLLDECVDYYKCPEELIEVSASFHNA